MNRAENIVSNLGFFSKPKRMVDGERIYVRKEYHRIRDEKRIDQILQWHESYVTRLRRASVRVPDTIMKKEKVGSSKYRVYIEQEIFDAEEMIRSQIQQSDLTGVKNLLALILQDTKQFWQQRDDKLLGFHPTLRNYAIRNDQLYYLDTFPPMVCTQKELNRLIVQMAPIPGFIKPLIPLKQIDRVSDEYYAFDLMIKGLVGSTCRLHPAWKHEITEFAQEVVSQWNDLESELKHQTLVHLQNPPRLSGIWVAIRSLLGKPGEKNV